MPRTKFVRFYLVCFLGLSIAANSADEGWKTQTTKDGKVTVRSRISSMTLPSGEEVPVIDYKANTVAAVKFARCEALLLDVSRHKDINDDKTSRTVETISEHEWIVHYELKVPWPLPASDCVAKMIYTNDSTKKVSVFAFNAAPTRYKATKAKRMSIYELTYTLKDLGEGRVELSSVGRGAPPFNVPQWMLRSGLPGSVSDPLERIIKLAGSKP
jgi:hypothetical protein